MNVSRIIIYNGYVRETISKEILCSGCIVSSSEGSVIFSTTPFELMEGFISVMYWTQNITYVPFDADVEAMAEALFSIGELRPILKKGTLEDFSSEKIEDYSSDIRTVGSSIPNISLEIPRIDSKRRIILKFNETGAVSLILEAPAT